MALNFHILHSSSRKIYSNFSERSMDLVLHLDGTLQPRIIFCSTSGILLGQLLPNSTVDFSLELFPISPGLQVRFLLQIFSCYLFLMLILIFFKNFLLFFSSLIHDKFRVF